MSRRPNPDRLFEARQQAIHNRLMGIEGLLPKQADGWLAAWADLAGEPLTAEEFNDAYEWIVSELARERRTPA